MGSYYSARGDLRFSLVLSAIVALCLPLGAAVINVNPSFESPFILSAPPTPYQTFATNIKAYAQADVPGWTTTDINGAIEIWRSGAQGYIAYQGDQWAEINAYSAGTLTSFVTPTAGGTIGIQLAHRGRGSSTIADVMRAVVTDMGANLGGTADDTVLLNVTYQATNVAWIFHSVTFGAPATGNRLRLDLTAVSTGSGNQSVGNFVDAVVFGDAVPEPSSFGLALCGLALMLRASLSGSR